MKKDKTEEREVKIFSCSEIKSEKRDTNLYISGYAAYFGNKDSYNDIIQKGAFTNFLASDDVKRIKLCYQHEGDKVIGVFTKLEEDDKGLFFEAMISNTTLGKDIATLVEDGALNEFSIGYCVKTASYPDENSDLRILTDIYLYEISIVSRAANPLATLEETQRKSLTTKSIMNEEEKKALEAEIKEAKAELEKMRKEFEKLSEKSDDEKVLAIETKITEQNTLIDNLDDSIKELDKKIEKKESQKAKTISQKISETIESEEFKEAVRKVTSGERERANIEVKIDSSNVTGSILRSFGDTVVEADAQNNTLLVGRLASNFVPQDKSVIVWPEGSFTDNTGYVDEGSAVSTADAATLTEQSRKVSKIGAKLPFTREVSTDLSYFLNWAKNEAILAIRNKVDTELISGLGADTSDTTKKKIYGIIGTGSTAFNANTAGVSAAIPNADLSNLIDAIDAQIEIGTKGAYFANAIYMHPSDFAKYKNLKDKNGALLFSQNGGIYTFLGKTIYRSAKITTGTLIVADEAAFKLYEKLGFEIEIERVASTDSYVMYLRWRGQLVVPANRKKAVIYVSNIATAIAAITGSAPDLIMTDVGVSALSATGATIGWDAVTGTGVKYKISTDNVNWSAEQSEVTKAITGLSASTEYTYYVKAVASGLTDSESKSVTFTTSES
jgi:HK97 family phage prohead protease/HK97 family phage major capsid protein